MITLKQNTTLVGVSELRTRIEELLKLISTSRVVIAKRHKPVAVLMSNQEFEKNESLLEMAEDIVLGYLAKNRYTNSTEQDYIDIKAILKK
jgi:prevent-host-death family protein